MKHWNRFFFLLIACFIFEGSEGLYAQKLSFTNANEAVLAAIASMPSGGGYGTTPLAFTHFAQVISPQEENLVKNPSHATPSFCSEATYLVFLKTLTLWPDLSLPWSIRVALQPDHRPDGDGIWGRWNANGPGTARLFHTLGLGINFTDITKAKPGDFLKIFWNDHIGALEHGHLVVYLGREKRKGIDYILCWSSNIPNGYGKIAYRQQAAHHLLFSRLTHPENILNLYLLPKKDTYLASLLKSSSSWEELKQYCALRESLENR